MKLPKYFYFRVKIDVTNDGKAEVRAEDASDVDVVEVVRCKDCKFWNEEKYLGFCSVHQEGGIGEDDFCSYGERKDVVPIETENK